MGLGLAIIGGSIIGGLLSGQAQKSAASKAAGAQTAATQMGIEEERRQYDINMAEYRRKQQILEQQFAQNQNLLAPYMQGGQSALYQMMALSGLGAPAGATAGKTFTQTTTPTVQGTVNRDRSIRQTAIDAMGGMPDKLSGSQTNLMTAENIPTISGAVNPYAGMTGAEAQQAAVGQIAESPLLAELTRQGEQAMLQNAAATGGLRGGNIQGALAQYRPQMLQQEIDRQYSRLAQMSGLGQQTIMGSPTYQSAPGYQSGTNIAQMYGDIGAAQAGSYLAAGQAQAGLYNTIGTGLGYGLGYLTQNQTPTSYTTNPQYYEV